MFWTCLPTVVCTTISSGEFYKRRRCSEQRGTENYGQKVVYGHVMNVLKPLLSISALKHRDVTIIFNHDYDRIIFRNETANLISHDCHSYLHITLSNGIPSRKTLVMA